MTYINKAKTTVSTVLEVIFLVIGIPNAVLFGAVGVSQLIERSEDSMASAMVGLGITAIDVLLICLAISKHILRTRAVRLNQIFLADADGVVKLEQIAIPLKAKNQLQAASMVDKLISKGYLINCNVEYGEQTVIMLYRRMNNAQANKSVTCPSCGANVEIRDGFASECPYCSTKLS